MDWAPKRILCAVDFSELSAAALRYAAAGARVFGARLTVLHAQRFELPPYFTKAGAAALAQQLRQTRRAARTMLAEYVRRILGPDALPAGVDYQLVEAHPADAILAAEARGVGLIVLGTHGRSGARRLLLGSVTESVVRQARVPVFVVRHPQAGFLEPGRRGGAAMPRRVLCPVNGTPVARRALDHAVSIAQRFQATLTVLHVVDREEDRSVARARSELCAWIPNSVSARCAWQPAVRRGHASRQIIDFARAGAHDLIVIGAQRHPLAQTVLGRTTEHVLRAAPLPVLLVPRAGARPGKESP